MSDRPRESAELATQANPELCVDRAPASERVYLYLNRDELAFALSEFRRRELSSSSAFIRMLIEDEMRRVGVIQ